MLKLLKIFLVSWCLLGQTVSSFGFPLAFKNSNSHSAFMACCTPKVSSCCTDDCKCCALISSSENNLTENLKEQSFQVLWLNPISSNKCQGINVISQFGIDMFAQGDQSLSNDSSLGSTNEEYFFIFLDIYPTLQFKPPKV